MDPKYTCIQKATGGAQGILASPPKNQLYSYFPKNTEHFKQTL